MTDTIDVSISMSIHLGDRAGETGHLSLPAYGAYCRLIEELWRRGGQLPDDPAQLRRLSRADNSEWPAVWTEIAPLFVAADGHLTHPRTVAEISRARAKKASYQARGRKGGRPSAPAPDKAKPKLGKGLALAEGKAGGKTPPPPPPPSPDLPPKRDLLNNGDLLKNPHCPTGRPAELGAGGDVPVLQLVPGQAEPEAKKGKARKNGQAYSETFVRFWAAYPRRVSKEAAWHAWRKLEKGQLPLSAILTALEWQRKTDQWTKDGGDKIPYPASYLNGRRWEDEPSAYPKPGNGAKPGRDVRLGGTRAEDFEPDPVGRVDMAAVPRRGQ